MSVHKTTRNGVDRFVVKWREAGRQKSRSFEKRDDARSFDDHLRRLNAHGELAAELVKRRATVSEFVGLWITTRASEVTQQTADDYGRHFDQRILPALGNVPVAALTPATVEGWIATLRKAGDHDATILKACTALQSALALAVKDGVIPANPVASARRPRQGRKRTPYLIKPESVELMRAHLLSKGKRRDAVLLELLAYAGLRPESEAITLPWKHVRDNSLLIQDTKRGKERTVPLVEQLRDTLTDWRLVHGTGRVVPARFGHTWDEGHDGRSEWRYWRRHVFAPAAKAAGLPADVRPRDLRGSYVSLLVHEGMDIVKVAKRLGHSPEVCLRDYAQVFDDLGDEPSMPAAEVIRAARESAAMFHQSSTAEESNV